MDPILTSTVTSFVTSVATNGSKAPLQSLDNLWYMIFGHKVEYLAEIKRAKNEVNVSQYKESISKKVDAIPEENLQEPPMSIVGPALEASKYYIEEEELREMFANVIAASMDSSKSREVHHSFVEIIKQLSPQDANNIKSLKYSKILPIANFNLKDVDKNSHSMVRNLVFSTDYENKTIDENDSSSISNIVRLGLASISFEESLSAEGIYDIYEQSTLFTSLQETHNNEKQKLEVKRGLVIVTPLGVKFMNTVL